MIPLLFFLALSRFEPFLVSCFFSFLLFSSSSPSSFYRLSLIWVGCGVFFFTLTIEREPNLLAFRGFLEHILGWMGYRNYIVKWYKRYMYINIYTYLSTLYEITINGLGGGEGDGTVEGAKGGRSERWILGFDLYDNQVLNPRDRRQTWARSFDGYPPRGFQFRSFRMRSLMLISVLILIFEVGKVTGGGELMIKEWCV